jgi:hypothetical protein
LSATESAAAIRSQHHGNRSAACTAGRPARIHHPDEPAPTARPTVRISPDLPVCDECLKELFDPADPRYSIPISTAPTAVPRYTVVLALPYDRPNTTMKEWPLDDYCAAEYSNPAIVVFTRSLWPVQNAVPAIIFTRSFSRTLRPQGK